LRVRLSLCLPRPSTAATAASGFAAECTVGKRYRSTAAVTMQQVLPATAHEQMKGSRPVMAPTRS